MKTIEHLIIIAGAPGVGKSSFLNKPLSKFSIKFSDNLSFLNDAYIEHRDYQDDETFHAEKISKMVLHVDLNHLIFFKGEYKNRKEVLKNIKGYTPNLKHLEKYINNSENISFLTIFANRKVAFERFINRTLEQSISLLQTHKVAILGSNYKKESLYKELYRYWVKYIEKWTNSEKIKINKILFIDSSSDKRYLKLNKKEFMSKIRSINKSISNDSKQITK